MLSPGSIFSNYQIEKPLGIGSMGIVYKATDTRLDRTVALKLIEERLSKSPQYRTRLALEAKAAAKIDSPYVVKVWEHAEFDGQPYISLEYVPGPDLRAICDCLNYGQKVDLARQIAGGLKSAHSQGLIHRDLKPENIKVTDDGQAKILDFGLAKTVNADSVDQQGNIEGTLYYLSPEQLIGEILTFGSDLFSFGIILYELFAGRRPFEGEYPAAIIYSILHEEPVPPSEINKELPRWLDELILRLLSKRPQDRYESIQEVIDCLNEQKESGAEVSARARQTVTVIDLKNLSGDESWEYFCTGFTDDLISELSRRTDLIVSAEPSTSYLRNVPEIFKRCRSDFVIVGSLMKWQDHIRFHLCIYAASGKDMISGRNYESGIQDVFSILSRAVQETSSKLAEITGFNAIDVDNYFQTDIAAYEYYLKGKSYYQTNKPEDLQFAERMFEKALEIDPNLAHAHSGLSDLYVFQYMAYYDRSEEKLEKARKEAFRAIEISPELPEAYRSLGRCYMFMGEYDKAEISLLKTIELNPKFALGYRTLGWLKEDIGDHDKAIEWAKMSLKFAPNDVETLLLLSLINMDLRKYTLAMATLQRAIELAPDYGRAYFNLGMVYLRLGVPDLALDNFLLSVKYKGDPNASLYAGYVYLIDRQYDKARTHFKESLEAGNFPFIALNFLGYIEKNCGNQAAAARYFRDALEAAKGRELKDKDNPLILAYKAMALAFLGETEAAFSILQGLEKHKGRDGAILFNMAQVYALLGHAPKVKELLNKARNLHAGPTEKQIILDPLFAEYQPLFDTDDIKIP